jgi:5-methylcytosine-specific restriction endonuclease McrA
VSGAAQCKSAADDSSGVRELLRFPVRGEPDHYSYTLTEHHALKKTFPALDVDFYISESFYYWPKKPRIKAADMSRYLVGLMKAATSREAWREAQRAEWRIAEAHCTSKLDIRELGCMYNEDQGDRRFALRGKGEPAGEDGKDRRWLIYAGPQPGPKRRDWLRRSSARVLGEQWWATAGRRAAERYEGMLWRYLQDCDQRGEDWRADPTHNSTDERVRLWKELLWMFRRPQKRRDAVRPSVRHRILLRDGQTCQMCGAKPPHVVLHVDHIVAVARGGGNEEDNLRALCSTCNLGKSAS